MKYDVIIIGAGPAGLSCAQVTASRGYSTLVIERNNSIGRKVCAGGITWNGLLQKLEDISQNSFASQYIFTRYQSAVIREASPIIATVNREELGELMLRRAMEKGAEIRTGCLLSSINSSEIIVTDRKSQARETLHFRWLVGADGSTSGVRKYLQLPMDNFGVGINYRLPLQYPRMEWHLSSALFGSGYGWVFPHKETVSVGAYADAGSIRPTRLKSNLLNWGRRRDFQLADHKCQAEIINFDYRGHEFGNIFLAGDAAGLASGLTGEGIYPAIISGEFVGGRIDDWLFTKREFESLLKNHRRHSRAVKLAGRGRWLTSLLSELSCYCLKKNFLSFRALEMAQ